MFFKANMRRHAWNCDLSTKPGTDILTNRHIYIYILVTTASVGLYWPNIFGELVEHDEANRPQGR